MISTLCWQAGRQACISNSRDSLAKNKLAKLLKKGQVRLANLQNRQYLFCSADVHHLWNVNLL